MGAGRGVHLHPLEFENDDVICCFQAKYPNNFRSLPRRSHEIPLNLFEFLKIRGKLRNCDFCAQKMTLVLVLIQLENVAMYRKYLACAPFQERPFTALESLCAPRQ